ncbi:hypothetical protein NHP190012_05390 [Helicobacter sp. NHP19-012]|uniref:Uncharacterized protein n=1 Tax=Helicobacter gastrofelis TaxID=2849642 RepID=A0ABM7SGE4_9HELI|nr:MULTISPECIES: hypothetical protein [unclassified Helicobacter]BCZ18897.1 hypothetical protein NHP190012_05390 [Helicobacter sp. NHP19-012]GMB96912.1 hypothetical protein NHP22001_15020 [Helicobacter sp. NHP22-001]
MQPPNFNIVGVSSWISNLAHQSVLLKDKSHCNIPNPIDTDSYKPLDETFCQQLLGLNTSKEPVGFGARMSATPRVMTCSYKPCALAC